MAEIGDKESIYEIFILHKRRRLATGSLLGLEPLGEIFSRRLGSTNLLAVRNPYLKFGEGFPSIGHGRERALADLHAFVRYVLSRVQLVRPWQLQRLEAEQDFR